MSNRDGGRGSRGRGNRRLNGAQGGKPPGKADAKGFRTDADIAAADDIVERKLEKWTDEGIPTDVGSLKDGASGKWDQFEVNSRKFGVKDTYDEHIYTTAINKNHPEYIERAKKAERLAREIEGQATTNVHQAEERGQATAADIDEETKYSGVDRTTGSQQADAAEQENRAKDEKEFAKKKKFNFSASAAKAAAFRPNQPPPPQYFVPSQYVNEYGQQVMMPYGYYPSFPR